MAYIWNSFARRNAAIITNRAAVVRPADAWNQRGPRIVILTEGAPDTAPGKYLLPDNPVVDDGNPLVELITTLAQRRTLVWRQPPVGGDELAFPVSEENGSPIRARVRGGALRLLPQDVGDFVPPVLDDDTEPPTRPLLRIVYKAPRPLDVDDGLPGGGPPPPPPPPKPPFVPTMGQTSAPGGGGEIPSPSDFDPHDPEHTIEPEDGEEEAETVGLVAPARAAPPPPMPVVVKPAPAPAPGTQFAAIATSLSIFVRATILTVETVERGNLVYFVAPFAGAPDEVFFSYLAPGSSTPIVDPGLGQPDSGIKRVRDQTLRVLGYEPRDGWIYYIYVVDTTGMRGGQLVAHFWGTGKFQASGFIEKEIKDRPRQLL